MLELSASWYCPACGLEAPLGSLCASCAGDSPAPATAFARAQSAFDAGRFALCARLLAADAPSLDAASQRLLGLALHGYGRHGAALEALARVPLEGDPVAALALAESALETGGLAHAAALLESALPEPRARHLRARLALASAGPERTARCALLESALASAPEDLTLLRAAVQLRGSLALAAPDEAARKAHWSAARAHAERLWALEPSVDSALALASAFTGEGAPESAASGDALAAAREAGQHAPEWHLAWVESLLARRLEEQAQAAAREALARFAEHTALTALSQRVTREAWSRKREALLAARKDGKNTGENAGTDATSGGAAVVSSYTAQGEVPAFLTDLRRQLARGVLPPTRPSPERQREVLEALCRVERANAVVTGPIGCGKSALLRAVAAQLAAGEGVPPLLQGYGLYGFDVVGVVGRYVGTMEERISELTRFCDANKVVLFMDDAHLLFGAGSYDTRPAGLSDALQPLMSSGAVKIIAATSDEGFEQLGRSAGFARRVTRIGLTAMDVVATVELLSWLRPRHEEHYQLVLEEPLLGFTARLAEHHVRGRTMPDAAIDLLERACAKALLDGDKLLTEDHVVRALAQLLRVPLEQVRLDRMSALLRLEELLGQRVLGQDAAVRTVCDVIRMTKARLDLNPYRPDGAFLFVGPSGVGKTELARALAELLNTDDTGFVRIDMGEFAEPHLVSRLFGTSAGFSGYERDGQLTGALRANPSAVVLLDEIEKAHPSVYDAFLQVFDAGRLTDGRGQVIDCSRATFILTSNTGTRELSESKLGFARTDTRTDRERIVRTAMEKAFRPEFLNRLDATVLFDPLGPDTLRRIVLQKLELLKARFLTHGVTVTVDEAFVPLLQRDVDLSRTGARGLMRVIEQRLAMPLTRAVLGDPTRRALHATLGPDDALVLEDRSPAA